MNFKIPTRATIAAPAPEPEHKKSSRNTGDKPGVRKPIPPIKKPETRNPPSVVEGPAQNASPAASVAAMTTQSFMPTSAVDFAGIADRYRSALSGLNSSELAAQRSQMSDEIGSQTLAAQRSMRALQGQQGIRGAASQAGMAQIAQQGQKATAGAERDLLIRNQQIQQQALANFNNFMQGERGGRLAGMLTSLDMGQRAAADAEMQSILKQYLGAAQSQAEAAQEASKSGGMGLPQIYQWGAKANPFNPGSPMNPYFNTYMDPARTGVPGKVTNAISTAGQSAGLPW